MLYNFLCHLKEFLFQMTYLQIEIRSPKFRRFRFYRESLFVTQTRIADSRGKLAINYNLFLPIAYLINIFLLHF